VCFIVLLISGGFSIVDFRNKLTKNI